MRFFFRKIVNIKKLYFILVCNCQKISGTNAQTEANNIAYVLVEIKNVHLNGSARSLLNLCVGPMVFVI